ASTRPSVFGRQRQEGKSSTSRPIHGALLPSRTMAASSSHRQTALCAYGTWPRLSRYSGLRSNNLSQHFRWRSPLTIRRLSHGTSIKEFSTGMRPPENDSDSSLRQATNSVASSHPQAGSTH